ncbi:MAG: hypothetical protein LUQ60_05240 [Methanomicrobiales archaeon]|nr:hypothetical protein [Methanomicrobiales archaeon]
MAISYITFPALFKSYVNLLAGESSPIYEVEGYKTPTAYLFLQDLAGLFMGRDTAIPYVLDLFFVGIILTALFSFYRKNRNNAIRLFAFSLIAIFLLIPRLKPNYFVLILVPIYLLILEERDNIKTMVLIIGAILPFLGFLIANHMPVENTTRDLISLVISYNQLICALAVFILIAWLSLRKVAGRVSILSLFPKD